MLLDLVPGSEQTKSVMMTSLAHLCRRKSYYGRERERGIRKSCPPRVSVGKLPPMPHLIHPSPDQVFWLYLPAVPTYFWSGHQVNNERMKARVTPGNVFLIKKIHYRGNDQSWIFSVGLGECRFLLWSIGSATEHSHTPKEKFRSLGENWRRKKGQRTAGSHKRPLK